MNSDILDEIEKEYKPPYFGLKSYRSFWKATFFYVLPYFVTYIFLNVFNVLNSDSYTDHFLFFYFMAFMLGFYFNLFGIISYLKSRKNRETVTRKMLIGGIGNLLIFLTLIWKLFLSNIFNDGIGCLN